MTPGKCLPPRPEEIPVPHTSLKAAGAGMGCKVRADGMCLPETSAAKHRVLTDRPQMQLFLSYTLVKLK